MEASVSCDAEANPRAENYRWFKGGQLIKTDGNQRVISLGIMSRSDHGTAITCESSNDIGTTRETIRLDVQCEYWQTGNSFSRYLILDNGLLGHRETIRITRKEFLLCSRKRSFGCRK